jgi:hypothetical protein
VPALRARIPFLVAVAVIAAAGCGGSGGGAAPSTAATSEQPTRAIAGSWTGTLRQTGLPQFRIAVVIDRGGTATVAYTGIDCGGRWTLDNGDDARRSYVFTEQITHGKGGSCKGTGTVDLVRTERGTVRYRFEGGGVTSSGVLSPGRRSALVAIWRRAGLRIARTAVTSTVPK